jgi:20S proteasome alpha/beta subunit
MSLRIPLPAPRPQPLKHKRYARRMTIAAGLLCKDAVLLCADSLYSGTAKIHDKKADHFEYPGGKVVFAVAGNSAYAWSAIKKVKEKLKNVGDPNQTPTLCERVLAREYRSQIFSHPDREKDWTLPYWILLAFWSSKHGIQLYVTSETSMNPVTAFECIGAGRDLAQYLIKPAFDDWMEPRAAWHLAAYALKAAKENVDGCGGESLFIILEKDGSIGVSSSAMPRSEPQQIEHSFFTYEYLTRKLLLSMANPEMDEDTFWNYALKTFAENLMDIKKRWCKSQWDWEEGFKDHNPDYRSDAARMAYLRTAMGLRPNSPSLKHWF